MCPKGQEVVMPYDTIVTRFPNFEVGFFSALLTFFERVRRHLDVTRGQISWEFIPAGGLEFSKYAGKNPADLAAEGKLLFNAGRGAFDQHGRPENANGGTICSIDILRLEGYDFLGRRSYLTRLYEIVSANDVAGTAVSSDKVNFRDAMTGLTAKYADKPEIVLEFLSLGFCGLFELARQGEELTDPYSRASLDRAVLAYAPDKVEWFRTTYEAAMSFLKEEWDRAARDFRNERKDPGGNGIGPYQRMISHPSGRIIRVCCFHSNSISAGAYGRSKGFDVIIVQTSSGNVQIFSRIFCMKGGWKKRIDFAPVVAALRKEEGALQGMKLEGTHLLGVGFCGDARWYFPEFRTAVFNGTLGNQEVPPTQIRIGRICELVYTFLPACTLFERSEDTEIRR